MSRGSPRVTLRIPADLLGLVDAAIAGNNVRRADRPYDRSSWIVTAVKERLEKLERGRKQHKERVQPAQHGQQLPLTGPEADQVVSKAGNGVEGRR